MAMMIVMIIIIYYSRHPCSSLTCPSPCSHLATPVGNAEAEDKGAEDEGREDEDEGNATAFAARVERHCPSSAGVNVSVDVGAFRRKGCTYLVEPC